MEEVLFVRIGLDLMRQSVYGLHVLVRPQFADTNDPDGHAGAQNRPTTVREMLSHYDCEATHRLQQTVSSLRAGNLETEEVVWLRLL